MENCAACLGLNKREDMITHVSGALASKYSDTVDSYYKGSYKKFLKNDYNAFFDELLFSE